MWILLVLIYGTLKGIRDIAKKKALTKNGVVEVLFIYTLISFLLVTPEIPRSFGVPAKEMLWIAFKSFIIFIAFLCSFYAIDKMPISLYGVLDLSRVLFSTLLGIIVLREQPTISTAVGFVFVCGGLLLLRYKPPFIRKLSVKRASDSVMKSVNAEDGPTAVTVIKKDSERVATLFIVLAFVSTFLNAISGTMDKILMSTGNVTSGQLQFWYTFYMLVYYSIYVLLTKTKIHWKTIWKNGYIWIISVLFVIADRCLFIANSDPASRVTIMTLLKQSCCIVTIIGGRVVFKEKDIAYRMFCAIVVIAGIVVSVL